MEDGDGDGGAEEGEASGSGRAARWAFWLAEGLDECQYTEKKILWVEVFADHAGAGPSREAIVAKGVITLHAAGHRVSPRVNRLYLFFSKLSRNVLHR